MTKNKSRPIALLAVGLLWTGLAQAQESANASGGDATGSGGTVAYSIGQVVYTTNSTCASLLDSCLLAKHTPSSISEACVQRKM